ncbi:MAG: hypothetical protein QMD03_03870 [Syntrophales bacterium]|nr:hypothetical protein [Syntrophales bacterium]
MAKIREMRRGDLIDLARADIKESIPPPVLLVTPREIDLGTVGPGESAKGSFTLKNIGSGILPWSARGPEGWSLREKEELSGTLRDVPDFLWIHLKSLSNLEEMRTDTKNSLYPIQLTLEANNDFITCRRDLPLGTHRETIKTISTGGTRNVFLTFTVVKEKNAPLMEVKPTRLDFGIVGQGEQVTRNIKITNKGRDNLKWKATIQEDRNMELRGTPKPGRYVSFLNEEIKGTGIFYTITGRLKDIVSISGRLLEENGYPSLYNRNDTLRYKFSGTDIAVLFWKNPDGGNLMAYIDNKFMNMDDCYAEQKESVEFPIADGLPDGPHILTLVNSDGHVTIEGVKIYKRNIMKGTPGWIKVLPNTGMTSKETDYLSILINAQQLDPGYYGENIAISSDGGEAVVEVSLEVSADNIPRILDVYRYAKGFYYLYTTNPQAEAERIRVGGYKKQGIAFRLFSSGTPGTTEFYRWYNPQKGDYFYSYEQSGGGKSLKGYFFEGTIGNIATSRLTNTRELYRWFNPSTGCHFYTTDPKGEGNTKKGYRFEGIAGYVR